MISHDQYFKTRFDYDKRRQVLWKTLTRNYFQKYVQKDFTVVDLGAGYGDFINTIQANRRFAVDIWPEMPKYLEPTIIPRVGSILDLSFLAANSVDFAFASNIIEHLIQEEAMEFLHEIKGKLSTRGSLNILQPNFTYCYKEYFDDYTHKTIYTANGLCSLLEACGYTIIERRDRFLPFSIKSNLPVSRFLISLYLRSPYKPFAKQMLIRARPA